MTLPPNGQMVVSYGAVDGGFCTTADAARAPATPGAPVWQAEVTLSPGEPGTNLPSSPAIRGNATRS